MAGRIDNEEIEGEVDFILVGPLKKNRREPKIKESCAAIGIKLLQRPIPNPNDPYTRR